MIFFAGISFRSLLNFEYFAGIYFRGSSIFFPQGIKLQAVKTKYKDSV